MRHTHILFSLLLFIFFTACNNPNNNTNYSNESLVDNNNKHVQSFPEYGFDIKTDFQMNDVSKESRGDFLLNLGGVTDDSDGNKVTLYQLILTRFPIGYKDLSRFEYERMVDTFIKSSLSQFENVKPIKFSYSEYPGYEAYTANKGKMQKAVIFWKDNYIFSLNVTTDDNLEKKFNTFTNSIKFNNVVAKENPVSNNNYTTLIESKILNLVVSAPCKLEKTISSNRDYEYIGLIDEKDQNKIIGYKALVSVMPMVYSQMGEYDKTTIKNNVRNMIINEPGFDKLTVNIQNDFAYKYFKIEAGFKLHHAIIMQDKYLYEFMVFSKKDMQKEFDRLINDLKTSM